MWSVTLTDAVQVVMLLAGLVVLVVSVLVGLGDGSLTAGLGRIAAETPAEKLIVVPHADAAALLGWLGVFAIGALGNVPGQDLLQRVFASKSELTARNACLIAGFAYLAFGTIPLTLALAGDILFPTDHDTAILPVLAHAFLSPPLAVIFVVSILAAITSTIDSAILSPASVLAQNVFRWRLHDPTPSGDTESRSEASVSTTRWAILLVASCSLALAYSGESAYALLEEAYALTLVGLFVPLVFGLYEEVPRPAAAIGSMSVGTLVWSIAFAMDSFDGLPEWEAIPWIGIVPASLVATLAGVLAYLAGRRFGSPRLGPTE